MKIFMCASEMAPFIKTGGLADVMGALPLALEELGFEVRVALPRYKGVSESIGDQDSVKIGKNVRVYFIRNDAYFNRDGLYGDGETGDYPDNLKRFSFYCRNSLELLKQTGFRPDIIHCHDWQAALVAVYLRNIYSRDSFYQGIKTLFTIHNLAYQGVFEKKEYTHLGLEEGLFDVEGLEFYGKVNLLKGGLVFGDFLSTVSDNYAREIQTKEFGCGLEGLLKKRKNQLVGILNGIDYSYWDPAKDPYLYKAYSSNSLQDKYVNKRMLQDSCGLKVNEDIPLFGMVSRLAQQKGLDLIAASIEEIISHSPVQMVFLGQGQAKYQRLLQNLSGSYPRQISVHIDFNEPLAHKIYASSDIFLMPSHYEPCGLGQMIALKYAAIPLVFRTGGLADTVSGENGFVFKEYSRQAFIAAVKAALKAYQDKLRWQKLVKRSLTYDFSWGASAAKYARLYRSLRSLGS